MSHGTTAFLVGDTAFKRLINDESARLVYPVERCQLQQVPASEQLILVMKTPDGFEAAFAIDPALLARIATQALDHVAAAPHDAARLN